MRDFLDYAQFESFWERFQPETPFGRAEKEALTVHCEREPLERIWDDTEAALALLAELAPDTARLSRLRHHLKRIPRIPENPRSDFDEVEIFQFKKFLHNYKSLVHLATEEARRHFGFRFNSEAFEMLLDQGRQSAESFYVADEYSPELAQVRAAIRELNLAIQTKQRARDSEILERWGFAFGTKPFLIVPREQVEDLRAASTLLIVEPFDQTHWSVRPLPSVEELQLLESRETLLARERGCEDAVLARISAAASAELPTLMAYRDILTRFDLAFARARVAQESGLVRPQLQEGPLRIAQGRFVPCEELCRDLGTAYVPLDATFEAPATVLFGSNMGGKTVVLKTLAFLQLCVQTGLFVPAASFETRLFRHFFYLGEGRTRTEVRGLSGFGFEIRALVETWGAFEEPSLVLFDEFARTTNSREAEAILSAVVEALVQKPSTVALFSTHFRGVQRLPGAAYFRMKGLDRAGLEAGAGENPSLEARIRLIDEHMAFHLVPDDPSVQVADAIAVAGLLGLDPSVAARAADFFNHAN